MLAFGHWSLTFDRGGMAAGAIPPKSFDSAIFSLICAYLFTLAGDQPTPAATYHHL
jgi:hypothetical protein